MIPKIEGFVFQPTTREPIKSQACCIDSIQVTTRLHTVYIGRDVVVVKVVEWLALFALLPARQPALYMRRRHRMTKDENIKRSRDRYSVAPECAASKSFP